MQSFFICLVLQWLTVSIAVGRNLRHETDLAAQLKSKHLVEGHVRHSSSASPPEVTIELTNHKGMEYYGPITLGGQTLTAIFDTGSYDVMAVSDLCGACRVPGTMKVYHNKSSKTFSTGDAPIRKHHFAGGEIVARQDFDTVRMGSKEPTVEVKDLAIWQVTNTTLPQWINPDHCKFTTIVGLGFGKLVPDTEEGHPHLTQLLERARTQHFAICFQKGKSNPGYVVLNPPYDFKSASFSSMFRHVPVVGNKHWAVEQNGVSFFNGQFTDRRCTDAGECVAIIDSGTSLIGVPQIHMGFISELASMISNDCSNIGDLPDLVFNLGSEVFPLPASAYVVEMGGQCYAAFFPLSMASDRGFAWVLGLPFLRHYYTLWDRQGPGLYIAEQGDKCNPEPASNSSLKLAHTSKPLAARTELTTGDIREARLPSWMPRGSESIVI